MKKSWLIPNFFQIPGAQKVGVGETLALTTTLPDDGIHGPNERQYLPNTFKGIETYIHYMMNVGG